MQTQRGYIILELVLGALVLTLLAVWGTTTLLRRSDEASAQAAAVWMLSVRGAMQSYLQKHHARLSVADPSGVMQASGYANWSSPLLAELKTDGLLSTGFTATINPLGGVNIQVMRLGACPGDECRLSALISSQQPLIKKETGQVNDYMLAHWLMAAQGWGGRVSSASPTLISGSHFTYANPPQGHLSPLLPGTVAMAITAEQQQSMSFLRVADERDPDFQGGLTVKGAVSTAANATIGGYLRLEKQHFWMTPCSQMNALSTDRNGGLLMCIDGTWQVASRTSGGYSMDSILGCRKNLDGQGVNPVTNNCSCPAGNAAVLISDSGPAATGVSRVTGYLCVGKY